MTEQQRRNAKMSAASTSGSGTGDDDVRAEVEIREGLIKALKHSAMKEKAQVAPKRRDELLEESFPKIHHSGEYMAKRLTGDEYETLRASLQEVVRAEVKEKMFLLREQLSEYHSVLEDVIAFKSRCERLEQEKKDLVSLCQEVCQVRDHKIALLEKELAQLRDERRRSSNSNSSSDWVSSIVSGGSSEGGDSEGHHSHVHHLQQNHPHQTTTLTSTQRLSRMNQHSSSSRHSCSNESRRITLSPPSIRTTLQDLKRDISINIGAIQPPPYQAPFSSSPITLPQVDHQGGFDNYDWWNRSTKKRKRS